MSILFTFLYPTHPSHRLLYAVILIYAPVSPYIPCGSEHCWGQTAVFTPVAGGEAGTPIMNQWGSLPILSWQLLLGVFCFCFFFPPVSPPHRVATTWQQQQSPWPHASGHCWETPHWPHLQSWHYPCLHTPSPVLSVPSAWPALCTVPTGPACVSMVSWMPGFLPWGGGEGPRCLGSCLWEDGVLDTRVCPWWGPDAWFLSQEGQDA